MPDRLVKPGLTIVGKVPSLRNAAKGAFGAPGSMDAVKIKKPGEASFGTPQSMDATPIRQNDMFSGKKAK